MINDVLEQLAEDYFRHLGYFTQHNIKYKPDIKGHTYAVHSDVDIIAVHPKKRGIDRVVVVSCKSWHGGLHIERDLKRLKNNHKKTRQVFREVAFPEWSHALRQKVKSLTGQDTFVFYLVCTSYNQEAERLWVEDKTFCKNLKGCELRLLDMKKMVQDVSESSKGITPAHSELSRLLQMIHHSGGEIGYNKNKPRPKRRQSK